MMTKQEIQNPEQYQAVTGEVLELHYHIVSLPLISKAQIELIKSRLNSDEHLEVQSISVTEGELVAVVKIIKNPLPLALILTTISVTVGGFFVYLSLSKVYKILDEPVGQALGIGASIAIVASIIGIVYAVKR